jgi:hypothetical protein
MEEQMKIITRKEVLPLINSTKGRFFTAHFIKKDGSNRRMTARIGVQKGVKGTGHAMGPEAALKYRNVWDSGELDFRKINITTVYKLVVNKERYLVV